MRKRASKRYKKLIENTKTKRVETVEEAVKKVKQNCTTKFDESIDVSLNLNLDLKKKKEEVNLRTVVNLPNGNGKSGKSLRIKNIRGRETWFFQLPVYRYVQRSSLYEFGSFEFCFSDLIY